MIDPNEVAIVTVKGPVETTMRPSKNGPRAVYFHQATVETPNLKQQFELEVDGPNQGYKVGGRYVWNLIADVIPGRYGPELSRRMSLVEYVEPSTGKVGPAPAATKAA